MKKPKTKTKYSISGLGLILMMVFFTLSSVNSQAQERITGIVKDGAGLTLPGVNVAQKGSKRGVVTDIDGKYSITLLPGVKTLVFSFVGFENVEIAVGSKKNVNVTLKDSSTLLDDVVIIGYQKIQREKVLGSVSNVKAESIEKAAPVDLLQGIQGKIAGVQILSNNGPGEGFDIRIRGIGSLNGANGPLYVVDGQQTFSIDNLNPNDIEGFEVLKDGATTAAYGAQGANGVVIVTTKSGKRGELNVSVSSVSGLSSLVGAVPVANAKQRIFMERTMDPGLTNINRLDSLSLGFRNSPDNQKIISRTALRQQLNVALSGGNEKAKYFWNTGYLTQEGIVLNSDFKRINTRVKVDFTPSKKFNAGVVANLTFEETNGISSTAVLGNALNRIPYIPIYEPNGDLSPTPTSYNGSANPVQQLLLRKSLRKNYTFNVFNYAEYKILPQLTFRSTLGVTMGYNKFTGFAPTDLLVGGGIAPGSQATANENHTLSTSLQHDNVFNYNQKFGSHSLSAFGGMQIQTSRAEILGVSSALANNLIETMNNADLNFFVPQASNSANDQTQNYDLSQFSLFTGFNYDFDSRYLIGATIRRDGSSRFGPQNRFGIFPSGSLGWRASKEGFIKNIKSIDNLLFRASYGVVGNDRIGRYEYLSSLTPDGYYNSVVGFIPSTFGNEKIKWESTASSNIGFDLGMFKRRLNITVDVWQRDTKDLLVNTQLPEESGFSVARENRGVIRNKGIDFSIDGTIFKSKTFSWNASFNIGLLNNKVLELDTPIISGVSVIEQGQPIGNFIGYKQNGIFQYDESNAYLSTGERIFPNFDANGFFLGTYNRANGQAYSQSTDGAIRQLKYLGNPLKGGDYIWDDKDNNGAIDTSDKQILGNGLATVYGGLTQDFKYKNFTLGVLFDYSFGNEIYRRYDHDRNSFRANTITPAPDRIDQAWTQQGDVATYPIIASAASRPQNRFDFANDSANSLYIDDGSFIRWRYIRLGYVFPKDVLESFKMGLKSFSLNLQVNNIMTWTNYQGYNPEFGNRDSVLQPSVDNLRYPSQRDFLLSLNVQF